MSRVANYRVERCQGAACTNFVQVGTPTGTTFNDTGLSAATTYRYRVRAADAAGNLSGYTADPERDDAGHAGADGADWPDGDGRLREPDRPRLDGVDRQRRGHGLPGRALPGCRLHQLPPDRNPDRADVLRHWARGGDDLPLPRPSGRCGRQPERLLRDPERGDDGHAAAHRPDGPDGDGRLRDPDRPRLDRLDRQRRGRELPGRALPGRGLHDLRPSRDPDWHRPTTTPDSRRRRPTATASARPMRPATSAATRRSRARRRRTRRRRRRRQD